MQVTEGRKCSKEAEAVGTRRGRQRRQSNILERHERGTPGDRGRRQRQDAICECRVCQTMPGRGVREDEVLREARRQVNEECRIIWRTRTSLIKEVTKGAKEMRLMGVRMTKLLEPIQDAHCNMCVSEGRFPKMSWSRFSSTDREDDMCIKDAYAGRSARLLREATARGTHAREFDETRLTKVLKEGDEVTLVQLWQDEGGPVWRHA